MPRLDDLSRQLEALAARGLLRFPDDGRTRQQFQDRFGAEFIDVTSNDYLGLRVGLRAHMGSGVARGVGAESALGVEQQEQGELPEDFSRDTAVDPWMHAAAPESGPIASRRADAADVEEDWDPEQQETLAGSVTGLGGSWTGGGDRESHTRIAIGDLAEVAWGAFEADSGSWASSSVSRETSDSPGILDGPSPARPVSRETSLGAGSSRLVYGTDPSHLEVEAVVAQWLQQPSALLFASGYAANVGALGALLDKDDLVVSDELNHASLIDGIRLSRARVAVTPHLDLEAMRTALSQPTAGARWVVVESYYSMDGDTPDLAAIRALCDAAGAHLYVDEAHAWGALGPGGGGLLAEVGVTADVVMAAFGKAMGSHGAAIAGSTETRTWLWNRARSFVFSTAPSPQHCRDLLAQLDRARSAGAARQQLAQHATRLRAQLREAGVPLSTNNHGPIVSIVVGAPERALALAADLASRGILVQAIRPPTVPEGQSRLRITLSASHSPAQIDRLARALSSAWEVLA